MTSNQLAYHKNQEEIRTHLANEAIDRENAIANLEKALAASDPESAAMIIRSSDLLRSAFGSDRLKNLASSASDGGRNTRVTGNFNKVTSGLGSLLKGFKGLFN